MRLEEGIDRLGELLLAQPSDVALVLVGEIRPVRDPLAEAYTKR